MTQRFTWWFPVSVLLGVTIVGCGLESTSGGAGTSPDGGSAGMGGGVGGSAGSAGNAGTGGAGGSAGISGVGGGGSGGNAGTGDDAGTGCDCPPPDVCREDGQCVCPPGYLDVNDATAQCLDIDECASGLHDCEVTATCVNTPGDFLCACDDGYELSGRGCVDIDECADDSDECSGHATCTNTVGGYDCACRNGFVGDGFICADVDECASGSDNCDSIPDACVNLAGGYRCMCPNGYVGDGVGESGCSDVDECAADTDECGGGQTCVNTAGSYVCMCSTGYTDNGGVCVDIDECATNNGGCDTDPMATCNNIPGSFTCTCPDGYGGTGVGVNGCVVTSCGDGFVTGSEERDPPPGPFATAPVDAVTCRYNFASVPQLYCNGTCTWDSVQGCGQGDADIFCKLRTGNPNSTASSYTVSLALEQPGFTCLNSIGTIIGPLPTRGVSVSVRYQDGSVRGNHGAGDVISSVNCTNP